MKLNNLNDLFVEQLKDVYSAEKQLITALPKMARAASSPELRSAFEEHLVKTERQKDRLDKLFERLGEKPGRKKCKGMEGLIAEGEELMSEQATPAVKDAGLIASAQKVEHYEMATYGTLRTFARTMGNDEAAGVLQQTLNEEGWTDHFLTKIAQASVNVEAEQGNGGRAATRGGARTASRTTSARSTRSTGTGASTRATKSRVTKSK